MTLKTILAAALYCAALLPWAAVAQTVVQSGSKITLPANFDGMAVEASPTGGWGDLASAYSYQNGSDRMEVLVYRPTYPSVSMWFVGGDRRTNELFSRVAITPAGPPEIFAARSRSPNAMRRFYSVSAPFTSTALAVVGFGQWIVSVRSSSKTLDIARQRDRLEKFIGQIVPPSSAESRYPVVPISDCTGTSRLIFGPQGEAPLGNATLEMKTSGGLAAMVASRDAFAGDNGVAAQPSTYCLQQSPSGRTVWFESVEAKGLQRWVLPIPETGITVEGMSVPTTNSEGMVEMQGVVLTNDFAESSVRGFYRQLPYPVTAQLYALRALAAGAKSYASVKYGSTAIVIAD